MVRIRYTLGDGKNNIPTNYYYNLLSSLLLIDINQPVKDCKICYMDQVMYVCDKSDNFFTKDPKSELVITINHKYEYFFPFQDFVYNYDKSWDDRSTTPLFYNPYCCELEISYNTVKKYLIDSRILSLSVSKNYDIIAERITWLQLKAQEELLVYLKRCRSTRVSFGELYERMIGSMTDPISDRFYTRVKNKDDKIFLVGKMNNIYQSYVLDNMVLVAIYMDMLYKFMGNDKGPVYNKLFQSLGRYMYADASNHSFEQIGMSILQDVIIGGVDLVRKNHMISTYDEFDFAPYIEPRVYSCSGYGHIGRRSLNPITFSPLTSQGADLLLSNSIWNMINCYWIINQIHEQLKDNKDHAQYHNYSIYLPKIPSLHKQMDSLNTKSLLIRVLVNHNLYEYMTNMNGDKYRSKAFILFEHAYNYTYRYFYGELALYPNIDSKSSMLINIDGSPMFNTKATSSMIHPISSLGNSVFSGHIQSHVCGVEYNDRHQYTSPIWLRPLYDMELFVRYGIQSHKIPMYTTNRDKTPLWNTMISSQNNSNANNTSLWLMNNNPDRYLLMDTTIPRYRVISGNRLSSSDRNRSYMGDEHLNVMKCSMGTMLCVRCYMISIIHMMASDSRYEYVVCAPTQLENKRFMKEFKYRRIKRFNTTYKDFDNIRVVDTLNLDSSDVSQLNLKYHLCYMMNLKPASSAVSMTTRCYNMMNYKVIDEEYLSDKVKMITFNALSTTFIHDSLRITRDAMDVIGSIIKEDVFGGVI